MTPMSLKPKTRHEVDRHARRGSALMSVVLGALCLSSGSAGAGNCLSHPDQFRLQGDTVYWSMVLAAGAECLQGLRGRTMLIDNVSLVESPKAGIVTLQGPSFRYVAGPGAGQDSFKLAIRGTSQRMQGMSIINVDVTAR